VNRTNNNNHTEKTMNKNKIRKEAGDGV